MKQRIGRDKRYLVVSLSEGGKRWYKRIHRLVAEVFLPNPHGWEEVNHIDGNKLNNDVSNLEWCTREQNMRHAEANHLIPHPKVLSNEDVDYIRLHYIPKDRTYGTRGLARAFNVSHTTIRRALGGNND